MHLDPNTYRVVVATYANGSWDVHAEAVRSSRRIDIDSGKASNQDAAERTALAVAQKWMKRRREENEIASSQRITIVGTV